MDNINQNNNLQNISLKGGVLIIGSLLWDKNKEKDKYQQRETWRNECLKIEDKITVPAPIRYGRISGEKRGYTYTMVFSGECNSEDKRGSAFFVPFKNNPINIDDLKIQVTELIKAERNKKSIGDKFYWNWGAAVIALNPKLSEDSKKTIKEFWVKHYDNGFNPDDYKVGQEPTIWDNDRGVLSFLWLSDELKEYDFFIATATKPEKEYPTVKKITDRMIVNEHYEYFCKNRKFGITTFQDEEISEIIRKHKQQK
jgi:hypothetical protein